MIEQHMRTYLSTSTHTSNFYLRNAVQGVTSPYGVVFKVSPGKDYTHDGSGLSNSRMQCSCFSTVGYADAKLMAQNIITLMEAWPDSASTTATGVQAVFLAGETDLFEDDTNTFHVALDFFIWHTQ